MSATQTQAGQIANFYGALEAVKAISTSNITLANLQTIAGHVGAAGDRILVTGQTDPTEDGIYEQVDGGAWLRAADADTDGGVVPDVGSMLVRVESGTEAGKWYAITNLRGAGQVGTDQLAVSLVLDPGITGANRVFGEECTFTPGDFTATIPTAAPNPTTTLRVYRNGSRQQEGGGNDYTLSGTTITFTRKLRSGDKVLVDYEY